MPILVMKSLHWSVMRQKINPDWKNIRIVDRDQGNIERDRLIEYNRKSGIDETFK